MPGMQTGSLTACLCRSSLQKVFFSTPSRLARTMWSPNLGMMQAWRLYLLPWLISWFRCWNAFLCTVWSSRVLTCLTAVSATEGRAKSFREKQAEKKKAEWSVVQWSIWLWHFATSSPDCLAWGNGEHTSLMKTFLKELHDCSARQRTLSVDWSICWSGCEQEGRQVQRGLDTGIACEYCIESTLRWCQLEEQERDMRARHAEKLKAWSVRWTIRFSRQMNSWVNFVLPTAYVLGYDIFEVDSKMFCNSHQFDDIWLIIVCIYVYMYTCVDIKNWIGNH